ncbi:MAG: addiction module toxin, HicA family [Candidatus Altiarchaeales archaeon]|nr:addiction module toxin, HicA family [Candidatus Altiarchaeales archaeon]
MTKLPVISGKQAVKAFHNLGWKPVRQTGSHVILVKENSDVTLSIPQPPALKRGLLSRLIKDAKLTRQEFIKKL